MSKYKCEIREIKFRAKRKDNGKWVVGNLVKQMTSNYMISIGDYDNVLKDNELLFNRCWAEVDLDTIGQYTELKDKNGREIYEGDIICWESAKKNYKVIFVDGGYCLDTPGFATDLYRCSDSKGNHLKVIGNIYDNKDFLEE